MNSSETVLKTIHGHKLFGPTSCISWGVELVLKIQGAMDSNDTSIQQKHPDSLGFSEATAILNQKGFDASEEILEPEAFFKRCHSESKEGFPVIFSFPSGFWFQFGNDNPGWDVAMHCFCGVEHNGNLDFFTRVFGESDPVHLPESHLRAYYQKAVQIEKLAQNPKHLRFHCLFHRKKPI